MNGAKIVENIFFTVTCISVFTCVIRSDYNFAMGLLSYYMIKNIGNKQGTEITKIARTVSVYDIAKFLYRNKLLTLRYLGNHLKRDDNRDGRPVDLHHEGRVVRQATQERKRMESFRQHPQCYAVA